jgi:osmotically-inducible protein OsmY
VGALLGFGAVFIALLVRRWQRDYELRLATEAVRREAALPQSIDIKVKKGEVILEGEVADYAERHRTEQAISTVPGIKGVTNHLRLLPSNGTLATSPGDIRRQIQDNLVQQAEQDAGRIRVLLNDSHIVLEGTVRSSAEASEAEEVAWHIPGVVKVENRLEVAG